MATVLGKRKARTATAEAPAISPEEAQEMLRRHFEAQFQPLDVGGSSSAPGKDVDGLDDDRSEESDAQEDDDEDDDEEDDEDSNDGEDDEWGGISDSEAKTPAAPQIEVVEHVSVPNAASARAADPALKRETKAYLSSRVPTASALSAATAGASTKKGKNGAAAGEDETSAALLRNDLALQRLLSESHLFTASPLGGGGSGGSNLTEHAGRNRHLATDLRLAALGSKGSIYKQAKMPMAHRKGIVAAAETREARRRREARENGIVLEKPTVGVHEGWTGLKSKNKKTKGTGAGGSRMRDAAVDAPAVGKLRNGMLQLSKKDVQTIQGSGGDGRRRGGAGGKRRRR